MNMKLIDRSGTGIEKSGTGIEKSGRGLKLTTTVRAILIGFLVWGSAAVATQNDGTGTSSYGSSLSPDIVVNNNLVTVNFRDGYKVVSGYGYTEKDYSEISLYSLEYVYAVDSGGELSETVPIQNDGTGGSSDGRSIDQQLKAWGIAEVVLSERGIADLIVYRFNEEGTLEEVGVYSGVEVH